MKKESQSKGKTKSVPYKDCPITLEVIEEF